MMDFSTTVYPRLWAIVCVSTGTVEYTNQKYSAARGFWSGIPDILRSQFDLIRYDPNPSYIPETKNDKTGDR